MIMLPPTLAYFSAGACPTALFALVLLLCVPYLAAQAQEVDMARRQSEIDEQKESWRKELERNNKNLGDASLSVHTRKKKRMHLKDQVHTIRTREMSSVGNGNLRPAL